MAELSKRGSLDIAQHPTDLAQPYLQFALIAKLSPARKSLWLLQHPVRSPAHCIEWAKLIQWEAARPGEDFDADVEEHMRWVFEQASARAAQFGIQVGDDRSPQWVRTKSSVHLSNI